MEKFFSAITKLAQDFEKGLMSSDEFFIELIFILEDADKSGDERVYELVNQMITCILLTRSAYEADVKRLQDEILYLNERIEYLKETFKPYITWRA